MTQHERPEWIEKAAQAVTEMYYHHQDGMANARDNVQHTKENVAASKVHLKESLQEGADNAESFLQTKVHQTKGDVQNLRQTQEEIAEVIHRHFQAHK